jgi:hypothetical protein
MEHKYYKLKLSSLQNTFSKIDSGSTVSLIIKKTALSSNSIDFVRGDEMIVSLDDKIFYGLSVFEMKENDVILHKRFEIEKSIDFDVNEEGLIFEIDKNQFELICSKLFSDFRSSATAEVADIDLSNLKEKFADWFINLDGLKHNYFSHSFGSNRDKLIEQLTRYEEVYNEQFNNSIFEIPINDLEYFIQELDSNLYLNSGAFYSFSEKISYHMPRAILGRKNYLKFLKELFLKSKTSSANSPKTDKPVTKIYFGAPGTGKSYQITQDLKDVDKIFQKRVTFHPEYDNASFVGAYKPITDNKGDIKYDFVPQIFIDIYVEACNDPDHQYYLIIEEINRGNCAEIFGELFQLLDRNKDYEITPSNELIIYLNNNIPSSEFYKEGRMSLPDNLSILATMNTSDQSLFPMDSAFKRRWEWEYIPINYNTDSSKNKSALYNIRLDVSNTVKWIDFIEKINFKIQDNPSLGMDKCIGNYFVKPDTSNEISIETFIYKVIFYLWNDVFKDEPKNSIFKGKITYQDFFPIKDKGEKLVKSIFYDLKIMEPAEPLEETNTEA